MFLDKSLRQKEFILLALIFGIFGLHWWYVGHKIKAILYFIIATFGAIILVPTVFIFMLSWLDAMKILALDSDTFERKFHA